MSLALVMMLCFAVVMSVSCLLMTISLVFRRASMLPTLSVTSLERSTSAPSRRESSAVRVLSFSVSLSSLWVLSTTSFESPCCKAERQCGFATLIIRNYDCCKKLLLLRAIGRFGTRGFKTLVFYLKILFLFKKFVKKCFANYSIF